MALIGKIRKNFWFVLLLLGLALAAFIVMDMMTASNRGGLGPEQIIGKVAGKKIAYNDFQKAEQSLFSNTGDNLAAKSNVWNYMVEKAIIDKQSEALGLGVSRDELMDLQFGTNLSPVIRNAFSDPQTGQLNMQQLLQVKQNLESGIELNPNFRLAWAEQEKQVKKTAQQEKLTSLVAKALYTPTFLAETSNVTGNNSINFDYVKIPFDQVSDADAGLTDSDISAYIKENERAYTLENEERSVLYAVKNVTPTAADSAKWKGQLTGLAEDFRKKTPDQDSIYVINQQGVYSPIYSTLEDLPEVLAEGIDGKNVGDVVGPYESNGIYIAAKVIDKKVLPDSVEARHILRSVTNADPLLLEGANKFIDSLENLIRTGKANFEDLATQHSQDPGSSFNGGDLGIFAQGRMVKPFNDAVFIDSKKGGLYTVTSQFGVHLIEVKDKIYKNRDYKYKLASIAIPITPSQETQDNVYDSVSDLMENVRTIAELEKAVEGTDITLGTVGNLKENDYIFGTFGSDNTSRDIIKWAFEEDTDIGNVSPTIYTYTDKINYFNSQYVVAGLKSVSKPGLQSVAAVKDNAEAAAMTWKKGQVLKGKISGGDLNSIASEYGTTVASAKDVKFRDTNVDGIGMEPAVLAAAFAQAEGDVSKPIVGNNGVYIVKTTAKVAGPEGLNVVGLKRNTTSTTRSRANFSLIASLKKLFKAEDNRSRYF